MFDNIADKIKTLATGICILGIISSVITGIVFMVNDSEMILSGLIVAVAGSFLSWISSFVLYGFGQLIENTDELILCFEEADVSTAAPAASESTPPPAASKPSSVEWYCTECGTKNEAFTQFCGTCGKYR